MKIKLVLDINKTQQAQLNAVVTGRQGDKETVTVNVFIVDSGVPYNLTGQDIYYEGLKPNNAYVRDTSGVKIINATQGNFEYTFRPETFGVAGVGKRSYFSIEQGGTVRASTQDFGIVTLADAMTGHTMSGPYISELEQLIQEAQWLVNDINSRWTSINTQLTQLENKLNKMDVVKRSGDTMTGELAVQIPTLGDNGLSFKTTTGAYLHKLVGTNSGAVAWQDKVNNIDIFNYSAATKTLTFRGETNLLKKTGDTVTGKIDITGSGEVRYPQDTTQTTAKGFVYMDDMSTTTAAGIGRFRNPSDSYLYMGWGAAPWSSATGLLVSDNRFTYKGFKVTTAEKDGRATLTLTADGENPNTSAPPIAERRGNAVTVSGSVRRKEGTVGDVVFVLPTDMRPTSTQRVNFLATDGTVVFGTISSVSGNLALSVRGKEIYLQCTYVVN